jgi:hypothetical protein
LNTDRSLLQLAAADVTIIPKDADVPSPQRKSATFHTAEETDPIEAEATPSISALSLSVPPTGPGDNSVSKRASSTGSMPDLKKAPLDSAIPGAIGL